MVRPLYETEEDLIREGLIMAEFLCTMNTGTGQYRGEKVPLREDSHSPDFRIVDEGSNRVVGYAEVKRRKYTSEQVAKWGGVFLSYDKYAMLNTLVESGYRVAFVVAFNDAWGYFVIGEASVRHGEGGRTDRDDPKDVEPVVYFDHRQLKTFYQPENTDEQTRCSEHPRQGIQNRCPACSGVL